MSFSKERKRKLSNKGCVVKVWVEQPEPAPAVMYRPFETIVFGEPVDRRLMSVSSTKH